MTRFLTSATLLESLHSLFNLYQVDSLTPCCLVSPCCLFAVSMFYPAAVLMFSKAIGLINKTIDFPRSKATHFMLKVIALQIKEIALPSETIYLLSNISNASRNKMISKTIDSLTKANGLQRKTINLRSNA